MSKIKIVHNKEVKRTEAVQDYQWNTKLPSVILLFEFPYLVRTTLFYLLAKALLIQNIWIKPPGMVLSIW